jgi:hypothetical protein
MDRNFDNQNRFVQEIQSCYETLTFQLQNEHHEIGWYRVNFKRKAKYTKTCKSATFTLTAKMSHL